VKNRRTWLGWANAGTAYDEVALELINIALRDAIFGVFVGITLSAIGLRRRSTTDRLRWASSLLTYGSTGAAIAMLPFVLLWTSMFLLPVGIAILGLIAGLIIWGVKMLIHQFAMKH
jgi:FtsH-binding integral membrane protein